MAEDIRLSFETHEGHPCPSPPLSAHALRRALATPGLLDALRAEGLRPEQGQEVEKIDIASLLRMASRLESSVPGAAKLQDLLKEAVPGSSRAPVLVIAKQLTERRLTLVALPENLSVEEYEIALAEGGPERVAEALATLATWSREEVEDPGRIAALLVPHLRSPRTRAAAARVVGALNLTEQAPLLERLLRQANTLPNRLAIIGGLLDVERDETAIRTLRSMLIYGPRENHSRIVDLLVRHGQSRHLQELRALQRLLDPVERVVLSSLMYRLGELAAYALVARAVAALSSGTPEAVTVRLLDALRLVDSSRFTPLIEEYADRETRVWFKARATSIASEMSRTGRQEPTCAELLNQTEHAIWTGESETGMRLAEQLLVLDPQHARALYLKASLLKDEDRLEEALLCATSAVAADPMDWQVHRLRGSLQWDLGRSEAALEAYDEALELNPTDPYTWYYKGYILYRMREPAHALPCLDRSLSLEPDAPAVLNHKAFCLEQLGRAVEATACYRRSLRARPADLATRDHLAASLHSTGKLQEALATTELTLKLVPGRIRTLEIRAETLRAMKRWRRAEKAYAELLREAPDRFNAWVSRGTIHHRLGNHDRAVECLRQAVRLRPESIPARNLLTRFLRQQRDTT